MSDTQPRGFCCDADRSIISCDGLRAEAIFRELEAWRGGRLNPVTRELIEIIHRQGIEGARVLDIGAGVGAVHVGLLEAGAASAVDVDASREFLAAARAEAERRGLARRVDYRYGDAVELATSLPPADVVTLDSVVCCYAHLDRLLDAATTSHPRLVGITYPRDVWWMRAYMRLYNLTHALRRPRDRYFIHRHARVNRLMTDAGYRNVHEGGTRRWRVVLYRTEEPDPSVDRAKR